ncbi:SH3 domain-containing protein [Stenotrophomonas maltophilia]|uniref:SH3 domain-containing protein n=1 Tax=Stenotrophomonas maltophilia TaxID=40324 RepID=UPI0015DE0D15|nr:SH3 domain-containing protein [Stenotrophomonas maltophilia]MBA0448288.1 SH3 domain-containing protein [Stenotrophomonas maltophilia]
MSEASPAPIIGLNIRSEASSRSTRLGLLPRGARITIKNRKDKWAQIDRVIEGEIAPVRPGEAVDPAAKQGWVFMPELDPGPKQPVQRDKVVIPETPIAISAGALLGHVGEYQQYVDAQPLPKRGIRPMLHMEVFAGNELPVFLAKSRRYASLLPPGTGSLFVIEKGARLKKAAEPDGVMDPDPGLIQLKDAGLGAWTLVQKSELKVLDRKALGAYSASSKSYANAKDGQFTGVFVGPADTQRTQSEKEARKHNYQRREMRMPLGEPFWILRKDLQQCSAGGMKWWKKHPLRTDGPDVEAVGLVRVMSRAELERLPAPKRALDSDGKAWWEIAACGEKPGSFVLGWACEAGHAKVGWQSPWAWPGFETVEEGSIQPVDMMAATLVKMGVLQPHEVTDHRMRADKVERSALVRKLHALLDTDGNGHISKAELQAASKQPLLAQALSRMIVRYESEWGGEDAKWNELDPLMLDGAVEWNAEKLRIQNLRWWKDVAPRVKGFPGAPEVFHLHPIGLLNNFYSAVATANANAAPSKDDSYNGEHEKSGAQWHKRFKQSNKVADLKEPFQSNITRFLAALKEAGVSVNINTTLRPPQRSYLMYYAREIVNGMDPAKVPAFEPRNGDAAVNIDWQHLDANGKPDLKAAKQGAKAMDSAYGAAGAIGKPYRSNHNGGEAIDMRLSPAWGIGKTVKKADGTSVTIGSKRDIIDVGASYDVLHWNHDGKPKKVDDPHWSKTGN